MKMRMLRVVVGLCMMFAAGLNFAAAPSSEDKPVYESLLAEIKQGYLFGSDVGPKNMEIIEKNYGLAGLERLYKDLEQEARGDQRVGHFRDKVLRVRINELTTAAPSSEDKPTYESLLAKIQKGYLEGNDVGAKYAEIIEKNYSLAGLKRLYKDLEKGARGDQRVELFRNIWLRKKIFEYYLRVINESCKRNEHNAFEGYIKNIYEVLGREGLILLSKNEEFKSIVRDTKLYKTHYKPVMQWVAKEVLKDRVAEVSEERKDELRTANQKMAEASRGMDISASREFRKELTEAIKEKGWGDLTGSSSFDLYIKKGTPQDADLIEGKLIQWYSNEASNCDIVNVDLMRLEGLMSRAVQLYKIHFMPSDDNFKDIVLSLIEEIKNNKELAGYINSFKIKPLLDKDLLANPAVGILPKIVIYIISKESAQKALNILYRKYKDQKGSGEQPPFNERITDLIYFTQGHRQDKFAFPQYFEQPDMVYFFPTVTGTRENYHLNNPAKK